MLDIKLTDGDAAGRLDKLLHGYMRLYEDWREPLERAAQVFYEHVADWFESEGEGSWAPLQPETISRKSALGYAYPDWPLVASGALLESASSPSGPYSVLDIDRMELEIGVDWMPAVYHHQGTDTLPARPIFVVTERLIVDITRELERHLRRRPA